MMKTSVVAKVVVPLLLLAGGVAAFVASGSGSAASAVRVWVDSPLDRSTVAQGDVTVVLHATADDVEELALVVDGTEVGSAGSLERFGNLFRGEVKWAAERGRHELVARASGPSGVAESAGNTVFVVDSLAAVPGRGVAPTAPDSSTTTSSTSTTTLVTTTTTATTTSTLPPPTIATTAPPPTTTPPATTIPRPEAPRIGRLFHSPARGTARTPITITAVALGPDLAADTVKIEVRKGSGPWTVLKTCTSAASPCKGTRTFAAGTWYYRATVTDPFGQSGVAGDETSTFRIVA